MVTLGRGSRSLAAVVIAFGALVGVLPTSRPATVRAVSADTVVVVDRQAWSVFGPQRQSYRPPTDAVQGYAHTLGPPGYATVEVDFASHYIFAYAGSTNLLVGHTYTHVKSFWNPTRTSDEPATQCDDSTFTIHALATDVNDVITSISMDMRCGDGFAYTARIASTDGYQLLDAALPFFDHPILPGQSIDTTYTVDSVGTLPLVVDAITMANPSVDAISIVAETCTGAPVAPGSSCSATLRFAPTTTQAGLNGEAVVITSGTVAGSWEVSAQGDVIDPIHVTPTTIDLGSSPATVSTASQAITVSFDGIGTAAITGYEFQGDGQAVFTVTSETCTSAPLAPGGSCTVHVDVAPSIVGAVSAVLVILGDPVVYRREVALHGNGTDPVTISPADQVLGVTRPGGVVTGTVTVSSVATVALPVSVVEFSSAGPEWEITGDGCSAAGVPAGGSCTVRIRVTTAPIPNPYEPWGFEAYLHVAGPGLLGSRYAHMRAGASVPASDVTWSFLGNPTHRWNFGNGLALAVKGSTGTLIEAFSSDLSDKKKVSDTGAKMPVEIARSTNGGLGWGSPIRVNPTTQHGIWPATTAAGNYVSVAWASATKVVAFSNTAPRVLYVRTSSNAASGAWGAIHRLTSTTGRVDHPSIAADGSTVAVAYTDSKTGAVQVAISKDHGVTWRTVGLGSTSLAVAWGKTALTTVAVTGQTIAVVWVTSVAGTIVDRISTNSGTSWGPQVTVANDADDGPSVAAAGGRIGLAWTVSGGPMVRVWKGGAWGATRILPLPAGNGVGGYALAYGAKVALVGGTGVGVAWSECFLQCGSFGPGTIRTCCGRNQRRMERPGACPAKSTGGWWRGNTSSPKAEVSYGHHPRCGM